MEYLDFELEVGLGSGRDYPVAVIRSPAGEARENMRFPYDERQLESRLKDLQIALLRASGQRRLALSSEEQTVQMFGRDLFNALITGEIRSRYRVSLGEALKGGQGLRLKLRILAAELAVLPWEFLYDDNQGDYICLSQDTPLVRYIELPRIVSPLRVEPPLRILGMIADPTDLAKLNVTREKERIEQAVADLQAEEMVQLAWLPGKTWRDLQRALRRGPWHIFHFIGHGGFDEETDEGKVVFCDDAGRAHYFGATKLARLLADHHSLRLALLNACEGAQASQRDIFSSTASILVRRGLPAVLAMQYEITDRVAIELARSFYEALVDGLPVDTAVTEARKAISFAIDNTIEWVTPVLYMRSPDGKLFDVRQPAAVDAGQPVPPLPRRPVSGGPLVEAESYSRSYLSELYRQVAHAFDENELKSLCFELDVDYDDLPAQGKAGKARELAAYMERHGRVAELVTMCIRERPHLEWRAIRPPKVDVSPQPESGPQTVEELLRQAVRNWNQFGALLSQELLAAIESERGRLRLSAEEQELLQRSAAYHEKPFERILFSIAFGALGSIPAGLYVVLGTGETHFSRVVGTIVVSTFWGIGLGLCLGLGKLLLSKLLVRWRVMYPLAGGILMALMLAILRIPVFFPESFETCIWCLFVFGFLFASGVGLSIVLGQQFERGQQRFIVWFLAGMITGGVLSGTISGAVSGLSEAVQSALLFSIVGGGSTVGIALAEVRFEKRLRSQKY